MVVMPAGAVMVAVRVAAIRVVTGGNVLGVEVWTQVVAGESKTRVRVAEHCH